MPSHTADRHRARRPYDGFPPPRRPPHGAPWPLRHLPRKAARRVATLLLALMGLALLVGISGARVSRQAPGYVGVVRNGGPFDKRDIRQILLPGQRLTWTGWFSQTPHQYPSVRALRLYTVTSDARRKGNPSVDVVSVPTRDGVQVGIEGTAYYRFVGEADEALLRRFDLTVGTRRFDAGDGRRLYAWEGDDGFAAMVSALVRPVLESNLRREIGEHACASLVASCAMVRRAPSSGSPNANILSIQNRINHTLDVDLQQTLSKRYFRDIRFRLVRVTLPSNVQSAVDETQAKYAAVNGARADARKAHYEATRNQRLGDSYNRSPALARIDAIKAAPRGATVIIGGTGKTPSILLNK